jgi:hypothetical protein
MDKPNFDDNKIELPLTQALQNVRRLMNNVILVERLRKALFIIGN